MVTGLSLTAILILLGVILPAWRSIKKTTDETYQLRLYLEKKYEQSLQAHISRQKIKEIKEGAAAFPAHIFKVGDELKLITELENLAAKNNVAQQVLTNNLDKITNNQAVLTLRVAGNYHNILRYIASIDSMEYFINIDQIQMNPTYDRFSGKIEGISIDINLRLYAGI